MLLQPIHVYRTQWVDTVIDDRAKFSLKGEGKIMEELWTGHSKACVPVLSVPKTSSHEILRNTNLNDSVPYLRRLIAGFLPRRQRFDLRPGLVVFVLHKVALRRVFSEHLGPPCQFSFHKVLHIH
jgi:hypothetical protein